MPQRLAQHLIARGLLPASAVDEALRQLERLGGGLDTVLLELGRVSEAGVLQAISDVSGVRLVNLADFEPNLEAAALMPEQMARQLAVVPLSLDGNALHVACAYPVPYGKLKDVGFLLGRSLELWVALECRIHDWRAAIYGTPLERRYAALLATLDPTRPRPPPEAEAPPADTNPLSADALDRIASGIVEEPVLLEKPKKRKPPAQLVELGDDSVPEPHTAVFDPDAYASFARHVEATDTVAPAALEDGEESTRVLDTRGYANFARAMSRGDRAQTEPDLPAVRVAFPGGVLPPRRTPAPPPAVKPVVAPWYVPMGRAPSDEPERGPAGTPGERSALHTGEVQRPSRTLAQVDIAVPGADATASTDAAPTPPREEAAPAAAPARERVAPPSPQPRVSDETDFSEIGLALTVHAESAASQDASAPAPAESAEAAAVEPASEAPPPSPEPPAPEPIAVLEPEPEPTAAPPEPIATLTPAPAAAAPEPGADTLPQPVAVEAPEPPEPEPAATTALTLEPLAAPLPEPTAPVSAWSGESAPATGGVEEWPAPVQAGWGFRDTSAAEAWSTPTEGVLPAPPGLGPSDAMEWTLAQARASLKAASQSREQLISVVLEYGRRTFDYIAAFAVTRGAAWGWDARSEGDASAIYDLAIPLDALSVFRTVALTRGSFLGPLPPDMLSQQYLALLGRAPRTAFLWPIEVRSRLVALLYGDSGTRPISQRRLADFILFCQDLPAAFHELILFRKQNPSAPQHFTEAAEAGWTQSPEPLPPAVEAPATDEEWLRGLIALLVGPDPSERSMAMVELMKTPDVSAQQLALAFPGPTGWSRLPVVELPEPDELGPVPGVLARLGEAGAHALAPLLESEDSDTRYLALLTAGSLRSPEVVEGVLSGLFDFEPDVSSAARAAATTLKHLPQFQARMPDVREELGAADPLRRTLAARALGALHDRAAVEALVALTGSADDLCAQAAAEALKEITRQSFGADRDAWERWWQRERARRRVEWLVDALDSQDFELRLSAIEELSRAFGDTLGYFADAAAPERAAALGAWREAIAGRLDLEL